MYQRVLVPLDGSEVAKQALPYASMMAGAFRARVTLLEAVSSFPRELAAAAGQEYTDVDALAYPPSPEQWSGIQEQGRGAAGERLQAVAARLSEAGLQVDTLVVEGDPAAAIVKAAKQAPGTLVVISTHGRSGIGRWMLGSVTDKVIRLTETPVLVVRAHQEAPPNPSIRRVVLALDGTEMSEAALQPAVDIAKGMGVGITLLRSISPLAYGDTFVDYVPSMYEDLTAEIDSAVRDYLEQIASQLRAQGLQDVEEHAPDGYAAAAILEEVGTAGDKLVVMATHARTGVTRWILGSVTDRVVRHSSGPVLVVHPQS